MKDDGVLVDWNGVLVDWNGVLVDWNGVLCARSGVGRLGDGSIELSINVLTRELVLKKKEEGIYMIYLNSFLIKLRYDSKVVF